MLQLPKQTELVMFNNGQVKFGGHKSHWFALVLNNENGQKWLDNFRKKNRHLTVKVYNRHSDRRKAFNEMGRDYDNSYAAHNIPRKFAERMAVYIERNNKRNRGIKKGEYFSTHSGNEMVYKVWTDKGEKYLTTAWDNFYRWNTTKLIWERVQ